MGATTEGTGEDNPKDPTELTEQQKDRAVTVEFENVKHFDFEIGASKGKTDRVFSFVFRPSLLCAKTKIHKHLYPATGAKAPIHPLKHNAASAALPSIILAAVLATMLVQ